MSNHNTEIEKRMLNIELDRAYEKGRKDAIKDMLRTWIVPIVIPIIVSLIMQWFTR